MANTPKLDLSVPRIHENGKKSCILHSTVTTHCGCKDEISQLDIFTSEETVEFSYHDLASRTFPPVYEPGAYLRTTTYTRKGNKIDVVPHYNRIDDGSERECDKGECHSCGEIERLNKQGACLSCEIDAPNERLR